MVTFKSALIKEAALLTAISLVVAAPAAAQDKGDPKDKGLEEVIVTGTMLGGTLKTGSLPVQVITEDDLQRRGDPSTLELVKQMPAVAGTFGETNRLAGQGAGGYSINLRGLGADKTLVLLNGKRLATSNVTALAGAVNVAVMPTAAIGRIEVLTDGGAATYGSDAVAGVVNFITRTDFDGLKLDGNYSFIEGSKGDYEANLVWGTRHDWGNILLSGGYYHRSELGQAERDWAIYAYDGGAQPTSRITNPNINPQNGYATSGNPGAYIIAPSFTTTGFAVGTGPTAGTSFVDPGCGTFAGFVRGTGSNARCIYHNAPFNTLVDDTDGHEAYGEINVDLPREQRWHLEALLAGHTVPHDVAQPSYAPSNFPLSVTRGGNNPVPAPVGQDGIRGYWIPATNPGLQTLLTLNPGTFTPQQIANIQANGLLTNSVAGAWRPYGYGGNPLTGDALRSKREANAFRVSTGVGGPLPLDMKYETAATYSRYVFYRFTSELVVENLQWALRGLGGFGCTPGGSNPATSTPGQGPCLWFNPFSTGVQSNAQTGQVNPQYAAAVALNPQAANSREVFGYIQAYGYDFRDESRVATLDATISGHLPIKLWADQDIDWALGGQYLRTRDIKEVPPATNLDTAPCPARGVTTCISRLGPLTFFGALPGYDLTTHRYALFGELHLPITKDVEAQLALRHEDLGDIGATTDPKLALRWQVTDWLALRGSASTTFRAPLATQTTGFITSGFVVAQLGQFKATDTYGNPSLKPETADNFNLGAIFNAGGFTASLDYYAIKLHGVVETDSAANMITAFFGPAATSPNHCTGNPSDPYFALQQRFTFTGGAGDPASCSLQNLQRIRLTNDNKQDYDLSGIDLVADYRLRGVLGGDLRFGADANYVLEYRGSGSSTEGILITAGNDYAGTTNFLGLPRWKGNLFAEYRRGSHSIRATVHYISAMTNDSPAICPANNTNPFACEMQAWVPVDLVYRSELPWEATITAGVFNAFDRDPPPMRQDFGYNTYTANPLGRIYKLGLAKSF